MSETPAWLRIARSNSPLILAMPHAGTDLPGPLAERFVSRWWALRDADWHIPELYTGLADATIVATTVSRSAIDLNRDPSGASLYPGQATTGLCPTTSFDGDPLYGDAGEPDPAEIDARRDAHFTPYHAALTAEVARLRALHPHIVVFDCHSIRSRIPRLFEGELPELNVGTNSGVTCAPALKQAVALACAESGRSHVIDGRFRGGWTTRHYGRPETGVHAIQLELAMRAYLDEPDGAVDPGNWPPPFDPARAAPLRADLANILAAILATVKGLA